MVNLQGGHVASSTNSKVSFGGLQLNPPGHDLAVLEGGSTVNLVLKIKELFKDYINCYSNHKRGVRYRFWGTTKF